MHTYSLSFPTRRSSDLAKDLLMNTFGLTDNLFVKACFIAAGETLGKDGSPEEASNEETPNVIDVAIRLIDLQLKQDRKSTRLNSSHVAISYAVFCLKKK